MKVRNCSESAIWADGLRHARLQLFNAEIQYNQGNGLRIDGPIEPGKPFDRSLSPLHVLYNGNTSCNNNTYALDHGARLLGCDLWYEGPQPRFFILDGRADLTLNGTLMATSGWHDGKKKEGERPPAIEVQPAFEGRLAMIGSLSWAKVHLGFDNRPERGQVLLLANLTHEPEGWLRGNAAEKNITALYNRGFKPKIDGTYGLPQRGKDDAETVLTMLEDLRSVRPAARTPLADDVTDINLHDVFVRWCEVGVHVRP